MLLISAHGADLAFGGAERYVADLAIGMAGRGLEPYVLSAFPAPESPREVSTTSLHSTDWRTSRLRRLRNHAGDFVSTPGPKLDRAVAAAHPDLVHTSNLPGFSTAVWESARRAGAAVVHTLHDYHLLCPRTTLLRRDGAPCDPHPLLCGLRTQRLARRADAVSHVIAGSEHLLRRHQGFFPQAVEHVIRLPLTALSPDPLPAPATPARTIGYVGSLASMKGVLMLLEAAPALTRNGLMIRIAGDGPLRADVEAAAAEGTVRYDGFLEGSRKLDFLTGCDIGIVPSLWEEPSGPPYVVCEWLAAGRPVLATPRGGLAEAGAAFGGIFHVEPTAAGLVAAVERLRQEPAWRQAVAAVAHVDGTVDLERWLDEHEAVYRAALGAPLAAERASR